MDGDEYFSRQGSYSPGKDADESGYSGFLQLTGDVALARLPAKMELAAFSVKLEGKPAFIQRSIDASGGLDSFRTTDPNFHLIMEASQRRLIHNALALARAMRRKVNQSQLDRYLTSSTLPVKELARFRFIPARLRNSPGLSPPLF